MGDMVTEAMEVMVDTVADMEVMAIALARGLLRLSPDIDMEVMVDIMEDMEVIAITGARGLLRLKLSLDMDMEAMVDIMVDTEDMDLDVMDIVDKFIDVTKQEFCCKLSKF